MLEPYGKKQVYIALGELLCATIFFNFIDDFQFSSLHTFLLFYSVHSRNGSKNGDYLSFNTFMLMFFSHELV